MANTASAKLTLFRKIAPSKTAGSSKEAAVKLALEREVLAKSAWPRKVAWSKLALPKVVPQKTASFAKVTPAKLAFMVED